VAALILTPNVQYAVLLGVLLSGIVHFLKPLTLKSATLTPSIGESADNPPPTAAGTGPDTSAPATVGLGAPATTLRPDGLLWLGSYRRFDDLLTSYANDHPADHVVMDLGPEPALDPSIEDTLQRTRRTLEAQGGSLRLQHELDPLPAPDMPGSSGDGRDLASADPETNRS